MDNQDALAMHPLWLTFYAGQSERAYHTVVLTQSLNRIRATVLVGLFLIIGFSFIDSGILAQRASVVRAWDARYYILLPSGSAFLLLTYWNRFIDYSQFIGAAVYTALGIGWVIFCFRTEPIAISYASLALIQTYIFGFFLIGLFFRAAVLSSVAVTTLMSIAIWTGPVNFSLGLLTQTTLVTVCTLLAMAAYQKEQTSRTLHVIESRQRDNALRQAKSDKRYLEWLRQLAQFLRHEVRQPVAQINSSVELLLLRTESDDLKRVLQGASQGALQIWNLIERASRATDAEAFVRRDTPEPTNVGDLLSSLVDVFTNTHSDVTFSFDGANTVKMNIDPVLLNEAVGNLLGNAASYALSGSTVELHLCTRDDVVVIRVRNKGAVITGNPERLFHPFTSTRADSSGVHQGLGLYIVRLIAEHYGGTARIKNIVDGSGVEASITFSLKD